MKPFHVFYLAGLCVGAVLLVTASWEFALEDLIPPSMSFLHGPESTEERLEHVEWLLPGLGVAAHNPIKT